MQDCLDKEANSTPLLRTTTVVQIPSELAAVVSFRNYSRKLVGVGELEMTRNRSICHATFLSSLCTVAVETPISDAIARTDFFAFHSSRIFAVIVLLVIFLRPNLVTFATVLASPALVLSTNISRSHSSRTPINFIIIWPELELMSNPFFTAITPIPFSSMSDRKWTNSFFDSPNLETSCVQWTL